MMTGFKPVSTGGAAGVPDNAPAAAQEEDSLPWEEAAPQPVPAPAPAEQEAKPKRASRPQPDEKVNAEMAAELDRAAEDTPEYEFPPIDLLRRGTAAVGGRAR